MIRSYPVPQEVLDGPAQVSTESSGAVHRAYADAHRGAVMTHQLSLLASADSGILGEWAARVMYSEDAARQVTEDRVLTAAGVDLSEDFQYYGILDPSHADLESLVCVVRARDDFSDPQIWTGSEWTRSGPEDLDGDDFVLLDAEVLADALEAYNSGSPLILRPTRPKAWFSGGIPTTLMAAASVPDHYNGVMVAWMLPQDLASRLAQPAPEGLPVEELHCTLIYLGDTTEGVDPEVLTRIVSLWAEPLVAMPGEISGKGTFQTPDGLVQYASVDVKDLAAQRTRLVDMLDAEGIESPSEHGFTPHITLAYGDVEVPIFSEPIEIGGVSVVYGDQRTDVEFGASAMQAAAAPSPEHVYAIVDEMDTNAVLDLIRVVDGPVIYLRKSGDWVRNDSLLFDLRGATPPEVAEIPQDQVQSVIDQVDQYHLDHPDSEQEPVTASAAQIDSVVHPVDEVQSRLEFARSMKKARERRLPVSMLFRQNTKENHRRRIQDKGYYSVPMVAASTMPGKLKKYWVGGVGAAKIRWGTSGDFDRCRRQLAKYLNPAQISGACANLHKMATGQWPGKNRPH